MIGNKLARSLGKNFLVFSLSLLVLITLVFFLARLAPGDPLTAYYGDRVERLSTQERSRAEERLGLKESVFTQYWHWWQCVAKGDFGISYKYKMPVPEVIAARAENTLLLGGGGFVLIFGGALLLGVFCARCEGSLIDRLICRFGTVTVAIPEFWLAIVLILLFAVELKILPGSGAYTAGNENDIVDRAVHLILPLTVVVASHLWYYAYMVRNKMLEEIRADYILLAKAKGLSPRRIWFKHALVNILPSYLGLMSISVPHIMGGTYVAETVFSYPGLGTLAYESARFHDYNLLMVICLLSGILVMFSSIFAQTISEFIDPRLRWNMSGGGDEG